MPPSHSLRSGHSSPESATGRETRASAVRSPSSSRSPWAAVSRCIAYAHPRASTIDGRIMVINVIDTPVAPIAPSITLVPSRPTDSDSTMA